jgi:hypothetical protein
MDVKFFFFYQTQHKTVNEWATMLTLTFAPLIAHIAGGVPGTTVLDEFGEPSWSDRLNHFNPCSIAWRYYAIADRRIRARNWDQLDTAACNTSFWINGRWDGSEEIMQTSRASIITTPSTAHLQPISVATLLTIIVALQGVQSLYASIIVYWISKAASDIADLTSGLPSIFVPLALLGLFRLQAALWLRDDFAYKRGPLSLLDEQDKEQNCPQSSEGNNDTPTRLITSRSWRGILFRVWWIGSILAMAGLDLAQTILPAPGDSMKTVQIWTTTQTCVAFTYLIQLWFLLFIHSFYILSGKAHSTIIPCVHSPWYTVYTIFIIFAFVVTFILAALETRIAPCGAYTTWPSVLGNVHVDQIICPHVIKRATRGVSL